MKSQATNKRKLERKDWRDYELQILKIFREKYPDRLILDNRKVVGKHSKRARQIDVLVYKKDTETADIIIECKYLNKIVTVGVLDAFYGKLHDLGLKRGTIVSSKGFSAATRNYAEKKGIKLESIDYEYLKDYYYISPNEVPDIFVKATTYNVPYCDNCDISILYEIGEVYGMAEQEMLFCPKCKIELMEVRSDANHRVVKIFRGEATTEKEVQEVIAKHINATKEEWVYNLYWIVPVSSNCCFICKHEFCEHPPTRLKIKYKDKYVCSECSMSQRTLLIDYKYL